MLLVSHHLSAANKSWLLHSTVIKGTFVLVLTCLSTGAALEEASHLGFTGTMRSVLVVVVALPLLLVLGVPDVYIENNGYKNIVVAIEDTVPYHADLIPNIQVCFLYDIFTVWMKLPGLDILVCSPAMA